MVVDTIVKPENELVTIVLGFPVPHLYLVPNRALIHHSMLQHTNVVPHDSDVPLIGGLDYFAVFVDCFQDWLRCIGVDLVRCQRSQMDIVRMSPGV